MSETDVTPKRMSPAEHYAAGMDLLVHAQAMGIGTSTDAILFALAHAFLGGLSSDLDYQERMAEEKSRVPNPQPPDYAPTFEEDQDRP
jgi:hypothetical protein